MVPLVRNLRGRPPVLLLLLALAHTPSLAQVKGRPVGEGSGPLSEVSTNLRAGGAPVSAARRSLSEDTAGRLGGNPVRGSLQYDVRSGPVSEVSVGPVTSGRAVTAAPVAAASVGAVTKDAGAPLGARISEPLRDLGPLQASLRALQPLPRSADVLPPEADAAWTGAAGSGGADAQMEAEPPGEPPAEPQAEEGAAEVADLDEETPEDAPPDEPEIQEPEEPPLEEANSHEETALAAPAEADADANAEAAPEPAPEE